MNRVTFRRTIVTFCLLLGSGPAWAQTGSANAGRGQDPSASLQGFSVVLVLGDLQGSTSTDNMPAAARAALGDLKDFLPYKSYRALDTAWILGSTRMREATSRLRGPDDQDYEVRLYPALVPTATTPVLQVRFVFHEPGGVGVYVKGSNDNARAEQLRTRLADLQSIRAALEAEQKAAASAPAAQRRPASEFQQQLADINRGITVAESQLRDARTSDGSTLIDTTFTMSIGETVVVGTSRVRGDKALIALLTAVGRGATK